MIQQVFAFVTQPFNECLDPDAAHDPGLCTHGLSTLSLGTPGLYTTSLGTRGLGTSCLATPDIGITSLGTLALITTGPPVL